MPVKIRQETPFLAMPGEEPEIEPGSRYLLWPERRRHFPVHERHKDWPGPPGGGWRARRKPGECGMGRVVGAEGVGAVATPCAASLRQPVGMPSGGR